MSRFAPYLSIVAALVLTAFLISFSRDVTVTRPVVRTDTAPPTLSISPSFTLPQLTLPDFIPESPVATSSVQQAPIKKVKPTPKTAPVVPAPTVETQTPAPTTPTAPPTTSGNESLDASASALRAALVNIVCYVPAGSGLHSISGSGVIVDSKGIILTNAHIAQYFLLTSRNVSCTIRAGSPATDAYTASLIYISPLWVRANADILTQFSPSGTGEYDFAFLAVTKPAQFRTLPLSFPFIPLATTPPNTGTPVVIASYGAQFLESSQIQSSLFPTIVFGSVKDVFTFVTNTIDVIALGGSAAAQEGSSGGGVADAYGKLVGTITTSTTKGETSTRKLDAITASYIRSEYASETGQALDLLLAETTSTSISNFAPHMPALESILTAQLH